MERKQFIDLAKGITIIGVVFFHSAVRTHPMVYYYDYIQMPIKLIYSFMMPFFFMVSAIFVRRRLEHVNFSSTSFLAKITSSILKPFYTISLLFFIIKIAIPKTAGIPGAMEMIKGMFILQSNGDIMPSGVLWFLFALFTSTLITFLFIKIFKINVYVLFLFSVLLKLANPYYFNHTHYFAIDQISHHYVFYVAGYILSERIVSSRIFSRNIFVYFCCWIVTFYISTIIKPQYINRYIISFGTVGIFGSLFVLAFAYKFNKRFPSRGLFLRYCGENSLLIYVFHTPVILLMRKITYHTNLSDSIWGLVLVVSFSTLLPLSIGKALSYNTSIYQLFFGRKP